MYPLKFSPVKVCNNGEIRFFPTGVHQDDDPTPTVVEEPDWKLELVENDPEPEWEMPESGIYPTLFIVDSFQVIKTDMGTI